MEHTPGPWAIVSNNKGVINVIGAADCDGWSTKVALVNNKNNANARLIAAAPDLLEALKHARDQLRHPNQMIDNAIAKAEGK